ncbi:MAG: hypothetical protein ISS48_01290 [Candidatus Aenigmarchaeota archaeon]|nr:hypothetical protein [Candidatus Aenigmarchaeota archaeon]
MRFKLELEDLKRIVYWTICKFKSDESSHLTGQVAKRDLLGGFLDRWINRAPEFILFRHILNDRNYEVVSDFFFYDEKSEKNAPDILGIRERGNGRLIKFVEYVDGSWMQIDNMPWVEVKTVRNNQWLVVIGESQFENDHYYPIVESHVKKDYLASILDNTVFKDKIFDSFKTPEDFIKSDKFKSIVYPKKITQNKDPGYFNLIGIFKGVELKKYSLLCKGKTRNSMADSPLYISKIQKIEPIKYVSCKSLSEGIRSIEINYSYQGKGRKAFTVPIVLEFLSKKSEVKILKMRKSYLVIYVVGGVRIDNNILEDGFYKILFKQFERSASLNEYVFSKTILDGHAKDSRKELTEKMDHIFSQDN